MITFNQLSSFADFYLNSPQVHYLFLVISSLVLRSVPPFRSNTCCQLSKLPPPGLYPYIHLHRAHMPPGQVSADSPIPSQTHTPKRELPYPCHGTARPSLLYKRPSPSLQSVYSEPSPAQALPDPPALGSSVPTVVTCTRPIANIELRHRL